MKSAKPDQGSPMNPRVAAALIIALGLISAVLYGFNLKLRRILPAPFNTTPIHAYLTLSAVLSALYLAAVGLVLKCRPAPRPSYGLLMGIIALAALFRLFLVFEQPTVLSSDMYRYIWAGRVQHHGFNPYRHPPAAAELKHLRDDRVYPHINRKNDRTLYPAGAQLFFWVAYALAGDRVAGFKGIMVLCDMAALAVMAALLKAYGRDPNRLLIYAWNPLVVFEIAYSGHLEGITVFLLLSAFYLAARHHKKTGLIALALSSAIKLYPGLLLPALLNRTERIKGLAIFAAAFGLLYLPYAAAGKNLTGFLPIYLKNPYESFNLGLKSLILHFFPRLNYFGLSLVLIAGLLTAGLVVLFRDKSADDDLYYGYLLTGWLMILMPAALHAWYVILIIPFLAFYPSAAWLVFSCTVTLSYLKYITPQGVMPLWVLLAEYVPLMVLLIFGYACRRLAGGAVTGRVHKPAGAGR